MVAAAPPGVVENGDARRYTDKNYIEREAEEIYGGAFREDPSLIRPRCGRDEIWRVETWATGISFLR